MTDYPYKEIDDVVDKLHIEKRYALKDLLLPGIRMKLGEGLSVGDVVRFYEPHVAKRSGPKWD